MDAVGSPLSTSPSPTSFSSQHHFYLAVDTLQFKMVTLMDLLGTAARRPYLPVVVCCSSRDELDAYSDLPEACRVEVLDNFRQATIRWNRLARDEEAEGKAEKEEERKSHLIVVTDACLPLLGSELPVCARILINYELPTKKEIYIRRTAACLSTDGIVINIVVGGEEAILKTLEESSSLVIAEMPIHIFEII
ncbi:hypothetical protein OROMI_029788 [Orobanche minor]